MRACTGSVVTPPAMGGRVGPVIPASPSPLLQAPDMTLQLVVPGEPATPHEGPLVAVSGQDLEVECVAGQ